jgi:hypothetical protein
VAQSLAPPPVQRNCWISILDRRWIALADLRCTRINRTRQRRVSHVAGIKMIRTLGRGSEALAAEIRTIQSVGR